MGAFARDKEDVEYNGASERVILGHEQLRCTMCRIDSLIRQVQVGGGNDQATLKTEIAEDSPLSF